MAAASAIGVFALIKDPIPAAAWVFSGVCAAFLIVCCVITLVLRPDATVDPRPGSLAPQEKEVARLAVRGCSNKKIAARFGLSSITVRNHLHSVYEKTGAAIRTELGYFSARYGEGDSPA